LFLKTRRTRKNNLGISTEELELLTETELPAEKSWVELIILGGLPNFQSWVKLIILGDLARRSWVIYQKLSCRQKNLGWNR